MRLLMETPELVIDNNSPQPSATADALRGLLTAEAAAVMVTSFYTMLELT